MSVPICVTFFKRIFHKKVCHPFFSGCLSQKLCQRSEDLPDKNMLSVVSQRSLLFSEMKQEFATLEQSFYNELNDSDSVITCFDSFLIML